MWETSTDVWDTRARHTMAAQHACSSPPPTPTAVSHGHTQPPASFCKNLHDINSSLVTNASWNSIVVSAVVVESCGEDQSCYKSDTDSGSSRLIWKCQNSWSTRTHRQGRTHSGTLAWSSCGLQGNSATFIRIGLQERSWGWLNFLQKVRPWTQPGP